MRTIAEQNLLLRARIELPEGLRLATDEFREGWEFARVVNAYRLEKQIAAHGWSFIKINNGQLRSGVGDTSQEAIANALNLALRRIRPHFNAAEVEHVELTQYPWFYLARVTVSPRRIQQGTELRLSIEGDPIPAARPSRRLPPSAAALCPYFSSAMPQLKEMLISSKAERIGPQ